DYLRWTALVVGVFVLALGSVVGGLAFGLHAPWSAGGRAVASIVTPSPTDEDQETPRPITSFAGIAIPTRDQMGSEGRRAYTQDVPEIDWNGDPAVVSTVYPSPGGVYGVGAVIKIQFAYDVPDELKGMLERSAKVTTSVPIGDAGWSWPDDHTLAFRPEQFWPGHMDVAVDFSWRKRGLADQNPDVHFRVGRSQTFEVSADHLIAKVKRDGLTIRRVPVSLGMPGWETASGVKTIMERYEVKRMVNNAPGARYDVMVPFALRLTPSGEFLHAAPWNPNIGYASTSHGCTNVSMEDAEWFYTYALEGDPVTISGTSVESDWWEGPGGLWNIDWADWKANSHLLGS
ncbi:MAG: L,D-transpeptidase, partial [Candidatus Nanopelagicales bacterium]